MKKFIIISLFALVCATDAWACFALKSTYNYYLFSVFGRETLRNDLFANRIGAFWKQYTDGRMENFNNWNREEIADIARAKGDKEMLLYIDELGKYLDISEQLGNTWTYPTKEQLADRQQTLRTMLAIANSYKGSALRAQWQLLAMRARFQLGMHQENIKFWNETGQFLAKDVYSDMMKNLYAGSLLRTGQTRQATDIYAEQGDMVSIKWVMRKYRNLAGIKNIYQADLNSATMHYLVQDFVNNFQECMDLSSDEDATLESIKDEIKMVGAAPVSYADAEEFVTFARQVVAEGKTHSPALWLAAIGEIRYLQGHIDEALEVLGRAMTAEGTPRMRDNARCIRMVASAKEPTLNAQYEQYIIGEMQWLVKKVHEEAQRTNALNVNQWDDFSNHYTDVMQRLVYNNLVPAYQRAGKEHIATALLSMMERTSTLYGIPSEAEQSNTPESGYQWNSNYNEWYSDYYQHIDTLPSSQLIQYAQWMQQPGTTEMERFVKQYASFSDNFFNDFIGTHLIAEGKFNEALPYLQKVPLQFMEQQNISYYLAHRDYTIPRWLQRQKTPKGVDSDGPGMGTLNDNPKLRFCKEIIQLEKAYAASKGEQRRQKAYDIATRLYQASYLGDCWHLTHYSKSIADTVRTGESDFISRTISLLEECKKSSNPSLRIQSLYALAFIPVDEWAETDYDFTAEKNIYVKPYRTSKRWKALLELDAYASKHQKTMPAYVSKCDVLRQFRKLK